jgi:DnaK suppressor protein
MSTAAARKSLQQALIKLRKDTLAQGSAPIEPNRKDDAQASVVDEDAQALSEMLQVLNSQRNKGKQELLARIDRALRKIEESPEMVGLCEECEEKIPAKRLRLLPYAALCAECQGRRDPQRGMARKKLTDFQ